MIPDDFPPLNRSGGAERAVCTLRRLPEEESRALLILNACCEGRSRLEGPAVHALLGRWLDSGGGSGRDLQEWLAGEPYAPRVPPSRFEWARKQASEWIRQGLHTFALDCPPGGPPSFPPCPRVLFGVGSPWEPWLAVFNSRTGRSISPDAHWLQALRTLLPHLAAQGVGLASSVGTLTYDLVTAYADACGAPLLLVLPAAAEEGLFRHGPLLSALTRRPHATVACLTRASHCAKPVRMVCRDRLLAHLAHVHLILELRSGGNLMRVLEGFPEDRAPTRVLLEPGGKGEHPTGSTTLDRGSPRTLRIPCPPVHLSRKIVPPSAPVRVSRLATRDLPLDDFLYHYTRACPGPWPGETYPDYLLGLLHNDPLAGHTALDTLIRILAEGRIRASAKLVRGPQAAISWTSRSPLELQSIRRWNSALIRWTFEPYGVAIRRHALKAQGIKPTIYAPEEAYTRLKSSDRFRFQRHEPPRRCWKHEGEWRLPGDFPLDGLTPEEGFLFVLSPEDAAKLAGSVECPLPVYIV